MNGWNPWLDATILLLPALGMLFGWVVRSEKAKRDCKRAFRAGYQQALAEMLKVPR